MSTILASSSQADAATTTTNSWPWDSSAIVSAMNTNGQTGPSQTNQVALQLSTDNVNWTEVDRRSFPFGSLAQSIQIFELSSYAGNSGTACMNGINATVPWTNFRLVFSGNVGAAVTIQANSSGLKGTATVTLTGTTATTGGAIGSWTPPMGGTGILITRCVVSTTTKSTGAANLTGGMAANATTSATNLITASAVGSATVQLDSIALQIAASAATILAMAAGSSVTFTGSASTAGLVGYAVIDYLLPP